MKKRTLKFLKNYSPANEFTILDSKDMYYYVYSILSGEDYMENFNGEFILKDTENFRFQKLNVGPNDERILMISKKIIKQEPELENTSEKKDHEEDQNNIFFDEENLMNKADEDGSETEINNFENNITNKIGQNEMLKNEKTEEITSTIDNTKLKTIKKTVWNDLFPEDYGETPSQKPKIKKKDKQKRKKKEKKEEKKNEKEKKDKKDEKKIKSEEKEELLKKKRRGNPNFPRVKILKLK